MKRDARIEFFRCMLMFGICLLHTVGNSGHNDYWLSSMLAFCVDGFVLISGYFGIKFSWKKILSLEITSIWCAFLSTLAMSLVRDVSWGGGGSKTWQVFLNYWFVHAYVVLMMVSPVVNMVSECIVSKELKTIAKCLLPFYVVCFGWSWAVSYNATQGLVPRVAGFGQFTPLTLIGVYTTGRLLRQFESKLKFAKAIYLPIVAGCLVLSALRLGFYNSPVGLILAIVVFLLCKDMQLPRWINCCVLAIAPSMFSVYLLHVNTFGMWVAIPAIVHKVEAYSNKWLAYLLCAATIFSIGIMVDVVRRIVVCGIQGTYAKAVAFVQGKGEVKQ